MVNSMTGFATLGGAALGWTWTWEVRSVNARGFDLRLRLPDWLDGLDQSVRTQLAKRITRGSVTVSLRLAKDDADGEDVVDMAALDRMLSHLTRVSDAAAKAGLPLAPTTAAELLGLRGIVKSEAGAQDPAAIKAAVTAPFATLLAAFTEMRQTEGAALHQVIAAQIAQIAALCGTAAALAEERKDAWKIKLQENLARVLDLTDGADPDRVAQELAVIIVKSDITEEIDRLQAHVDAARALLEADGPVGRKLDFLSQEFNREANTICSKAQSADLTRIGLDLKAVIDQMREQVQNVE